MSNMTVFGNANLPATTNLTTALRGLQTGKTGGNGELFLRFDKTGHWVFGAEQTEVEKDSEWAVNPYSFQHGFIAWADGAPVGERMVPVTDPLPDMGPAPAAAERGWEAQVGVSLKCLTGEDKDIDVRYAATSVGGKKALQALALAIAGQCETNPEAPVAIVRLVKDTYKHKKYGTIQNPVLEIVRWMSITGEEPEAAGEEAPATPARRQRRAI